MTAINKKYNSSYNFTAPDIADDADKMVEPVFPTSCVVTPTLASNKTDVVVNRQNTIIKLGDLTAAAELKLNPESQNLNIGAIVAVSWKSDSTARNVTVKVGSTTVATLTGTASTSVTKQFMWDGEGFLAL